MTAVERAVVIHRHVRLLVDHDFTRRIIEVVVVKLVIRQRVGDVMRVDLDQAWVVAVTENLQKNADLACYSFKLCTSRCHTATPQTLSESYVK